MPLPAGDKRLHGAGLESCQQIHPAAKAGGCNACRLRDTVVTSIMIALILRT